MLSQIQCIVQCLSGNLGCNVLQVLNKIVKASFRPWDGFLRGSRNSHKLKYKDRVLHCCRTHSLGTQSSATATNTPPLTQDRGTPSSSNEDEISLQYVKKKGEGFQELSVDCREDVTPRRNYVRHIHVYFPAVCL